MNRKVQELIHIVTAADGNYIEQLAVMLLSLADSCAQKVQVTVLQSGIEQSQVFRITKPLPENISTSFVDCDSLQEELPTVSSDTCLRISKATYLRIFMAKFVSGSRVLYLDADTVINGDISLLWQLDLRSNAIAAVVDRPLRERNRENKASHADYFNAGMMLIDLARWQAIEVEPRSMDYYRKATSGALCFNDQDCLNAVLAEYTLFLDESFNYQTVAANEDKWRGCFLTQPLLIHYTGADKPWLIHSLHPFREKYRQIKEMTLFSENPMGIYLDSWDKSLLSKTEKVDSPFYIYGAGERGRRIYHALKRLNRLGVFKGFIDRSPPQSHYDGNVIFVRAPEDAETIIIATAPNSDVLLKQLSTTHPKCKVICGFYW
jgi:lipopolysaccharide biosynthesis glycosyltransferase